MFSIYHRDYFRLELRCLVEIINGDDFIDPGVTQRWKDKDGQMEVELDMYGGNQNG